MKIEEAIVASSAPAFGPDRVAGPVSAIDVVQ